MPRIALIHALAHSMAPVNAALQAAWPEAERMNLLDDSLSADLARQGRLDERLMQRFCALADYAVASGAQGVLFTCSAFGPCIEAAAARHPGVPVLKPNEAMIEDALAWQRQRASERDGEGDGAPASAAIGLVASFAPTLASMPPEFPAGTALHTALAEGALAALDAGDGAGHDRRAADAAAQLAARGCGVIALAQFSLARAADAVRERTGLPVLTTLDSAVAQLRRRLGAGARP